MNLDTDGKCHIVSYEEYTSFEVSVLLMYRVQTEAPRRYRFAFRPGREINGRGVGPPNNNQYSMNPLEQARAHQNYLRNQQAQRPMMQKLTDYVLNNKKEIAIDLAGYSTGYVLGGLASLGPSLRPAAGWADRFIRERLEYQGARAGGRRGDRVLGVDDNDQQDQTDSNLDDESRRG
ncbi:hypothetical protein CEP52_016453 [Fusarium oligoseptatum]|uniref:Uncharacterized protein n=1 Tax=Fusarium oligoseptatum TaxID=2604345 RepID=A0A428S3H2_9HYPO|nr:hypothetical protein CEP52_016453 [Fusarium oligoseptatum]